MVFRNYILALAAFGASAALPASAATITYTISGIGGAQIAGQAYNGPFSIVGEADASVDLNPSADITAYLFNSLSITFDGGVAHAIDPTLFFTNKAANLAGILTVNGGLRNVIHIVSPLFGTYDPATALAPTDVGIAQSFNPLLRTDIGQITWVYPLFAGQFSATLPGSSGVPEPQSWILLILGFALAGASVRRHSRKGKLIAG
jgi:hypothetical protein